MTRRETGGPRRPNTGWGARLVPALAVALGSGALVLALSLLLCVLAASGGQWLAGEPPTVLARLASVGTYQALAATLLASSAGLFVIREFGPGSR
jgi:hypothetical protein